MSEGVAVLDGDEDVDPEESLDALLASGHLDPWRCSQAKKLLGLLKEIEGVEEFSDAWDARADYHIETEFNLEEFLEDGRYLRIPGETSPGELPPYMLEADNFLCKLIGGVHDLIDSLQRGCENRLEGTDCYCEIDWSLGKDFLRELLPSFRDVFATNTHWNVVGRLVLMERGLRASGASFEEWETPNKGPLDDRWHCLANAFLRLVARENEEERS